MAQPNPENPTPDEAYRKVVAALQAVKDLPYDGEAVGQLDHALQCAALARSSGADPEVVVAALVHDVGRSPVVLWEVGPPSGEHGSVAREWLAPIVGERVAWLAGAHVSAKRYLVATDPFYERGLSGTSRRTLDRQGGPMSAREIALFEGHPFWREAVELRRWDDLGKDPEAEVSPLEVYERDLKSVIAGAHPSERRAR